MSRQGESTGNNMPSLFQKYSRGVTSLFQKYTQPSEEERLEISALPPVTPPQFEPAVAATIAQQITLPSEPEPVPAPKPRAVPTITVAPEPPKMKYVERPKLVGHIKGEPQYKGTEKVPTTESMLEVVNHWMRKHVTGEMVSFEAMEKSTGIPQGILLNVWRSFKRVAPVGIPFLLEAAEGISKAPVETLKQFAKYPIEWGGRLQTLRDPFASPYDKRKAAEEWAEDPLGPIFAFGIAKGGIKAGAGLAKGVKAAVKPPVRPVEAIKPVIRPEVPVPAAKSVAPPVVAHTKPVSAARSAAVRKRQADYIVVDPKHISDLPALDAIQGVNMAKDYPQALAGVRVGHRGRSPVGSRDILSRKRTEHQNYDLMPLEELPARFKELYGKESVADANGVYVDMGKLLDIAENEARTYMFESPGAAMERASGFESVLEPEMMYQAGLPPPLPEYPALMEFRTFTGIPDPKMLMGAVRDISKMTSEMIEGVKMPPKIRKGFEAGIEVMIEHDRMIRRSEATRNYLEMVIDKNVTKDRQLDMVHAYEHKMTGPYWESLNSLEQSLTKWLGSEKGKLNDFIDKNKILERMEEKDINHIFHHWLNPDTGEPYQAMYGKFSKGLPQAKQRTIPTYEAGVEQGMTPATTNLGRLIGLEWQSATRSHQSRQMFASLNSIEAGVEGGIILRQGAKPKPLRMIERWDLLRDQGLTEGYERYQSPLLDKPIAYKDAKGKAVIIKPGAIGIRKELYNHVRAYLENPNYGTFDRVNTVAKSLKLASFFHATQLGFQELANWRIPFKNIPRGLRKAGEWDDPVLRLLYQEGLELRRGYEDLGYRNAFFEPKGAFGKAANQITKPIQFMRDFIFDIVQPGMKTSFAYDTYSKYRPKYNEWGHKRGMTEKQIDQFVARESVKAADGHFSGEHYKRSLLETNRFMVKMYFSPESRVWWQRLLLSPTWQREHLIVFKNVVKSFMPESMIKKLGLKEMGPIKSSFREYALGGSTIIGAADLWNQMSTYTMDGESKHLWENPPGKGFAIRAWWDEPDYTVTRADGTQQTIRGGPAYFRPLKSVFEVAEFADDPIRKFGYKLSPFMTAVGRQFWPSVYQKQYEGWADMDRRLWDFITDVGSPIAAERAAEVVKGKKEPIAAILPFFGFPTSKVRNVSKRTALNKINVLIHEGDVEEAYSLIREWNRRNPGDIIVPEAAYYGVE